MNELKQPSWIQTEEMISFLRHLVVKWCRFLHSVLVASNQAEIRTLRCSKWIRKAKGFRACIHLRVFYKMRGVWGWFNVSCERLHWNYFWFCCAAQPELVPLWRFELALQGVPEGKFSTRQASCDWRQIQSFSTGWSSNALSFSMFNVLTHIYPNLMIVFSFNVEQWGCNKNEETTGSLDLIKSRKAKKCAQMFEEKIARDVLCPHQASNYKIHVTLSLFSGSSGRVCVPCHRVCMAETSNIPILFGPGQNFSFTHTWAQCMRRLGQIASVILLSVVLFIQINNRKITIFKRVSYIYIEYIKMQKK